MGARFFDKVVIRATDSTPPAMANGEGVTEYLVDFDADVTISKLMEKAKLDIEPEGQDAIGDGTTETYSEKVAVDFTAIMSYSGYTALQTAIFGNLVDISYIDSEDEDVEQGGIPYAEAVRLSAKVTMEGGNRLKVQVTGGRISQQATNFWSLIEPAEA